MAKAATIRGILDFTVSIALLGAAGVVIWSNLPTQPELPDSVSVAGLPAVGDERQTLTVVEYTDFQCPYCGRFAREIFPTLRDAEIRSGAIRWVFRPVGIERIHPSAVNAAAAALCSGEQGRFSEMHKALFADQDKLGVKEYSEFASELGLDLPSFNACMEKTPDRVRQATVEARTLGVTSTPTFFLGTSDRQGRVNVRSKVSGYMSTTEFREIIANVSAVRFVTILWVALAVGLVVLGAVLVVRRRGRAKAEQLAT